MINKFKKYYSWGIILLGLTPLIWFVGKTGYIINGLDTNFPLNPLVWLGRRFFVWNSSVNAGVDFSSSISGIFFHLIQTIPYIVGFSLQNTEIISLVFWFTAIVGSSYLFSRIITPKNFIAQVIFVCLYSFNTYLFNTWENVKVSNLALVVALPLFLSILYAFKQKLISVRKMILFSTIASLVVSGSGINPAYFITILLVIFVDTIVFTLFGNKSLRKRNLKTGVTVSAILLIVNAYWILPLIHSLFLSQTIRSLQDIGLTNWLDSLSENTSLVNIFRLFGAWDWFIVDKVGSPIYIPYSVKYFQNPLFILFSFSFLIIAIFSFLFSGKSQRKYLYTLFGVLTMLGIFLGAGTHSPTGVFYKFLVEKIPLFSFFRSPWYIFTPLTILGYAGLAALFYFSLSRKLNKTILTLIGVGFVLANFIYNYPLVTGRIFRPARSDGFFVKIPPYVMDARVWLDNKDPHNRIIAYPDDQLESFEWGYRGTDSIIGLFTRHEFLTPGFNATNVSFTSMMNRFYEYIKKKDYEAALAYLPFLGADKLLVKNDASTISPKIDLNQKIWTDRASKTNFGEWNFLEVKDPSYADKIYISRELYSNTGNEETIAHGIRYLDPESVIKNADDKEAAKIPIEVINPLLFTEGENQAKLEDIANATQRYKFSVSKDSNYTILIDALGAVESRSESAVLKIYQENTTLYSRSSLGINKGFYFFDAFSLKPGSYQSEVSFVPKNYIIQPEGTITITSTDNSEYKFPLKTKDFDPYKKYRLSFDYKYLYGAQPEIQFKQSTSKAEIKIESHSLSGYQDWRKLNFDFTPVFVESDLDINIVIPANKQDFRTKAELANFSLVPIQNGRMLVIEEKQGNFQENDLKVEYKKISPVEYSIIIPPVPKGFVLGFKENYNVEWKLQENGQTLNSPHFSNNGFSNGWYLPATGEGYNLKIIYYPQKYLVYGTAVTITFIVGVIIIIFIPSKLWKKYE